MSIPYYVTGLSGKDPFVGREDELKTICSGLTQEELVNFLIIGGQQIGKSALMEQIPYYASATTKETVPLRYIQVDTGHHDTLESLFYRCVHRIAGELEFPLSEQWTAANPSTISDQILAILSLHRKPGGSRVILLVDNIHRLYEERSEQEITTVHWLSSILSELRSAPICFVVASRLMKPDNLGLKKLASNSDIPWTVVRLRALLDEEAEKLVSELTSKKLDPKLVKSILQQAGNHPLVIKRLTQQTCNYRSSDIAQVTVGDVKKAANDLFISLPLFELWFSSLRNSPDEQASIGERVFDLMIRQSEFTITEEFLRSKIKPMKYWDFQHALEYLENLGFIAREELSSDDPSSPGYPPDHTAQEWRVVAGEIIRSKWNAIYPKPIVHLQDDQKLKIAPSAEGRTGEEEAIFSWLHLSDLHIGIKNGEHDWQSLSNALLRDLKEHREAAAEIDKRLAGVQFRPKVIFITGDVAFQGKIEDYEKAKKLLTQIRKITEVAPNRIFMVPGNHDVIRTVAENNPYHNLVYNKLKSLTSEKDWHETLRIFWKHEDLQEIIAFKFANYIDFAKAYGKKDKSKKGDLSNHKSALSYACKIPVGERLVRVLGVNSAWISWTDGEDRERALWIGRPGLEEILGNNPEDKLLTICLVHHPEEALNENDSAWGYLEKKCKIILHGHLHKQRVKGGIEPEHEHYCLMGGSIHQGGTWISQRYSYGQVNLITGSLDVWFRMTTPGEDPIYVRDNLTYPEKHPDGHIEIKNAFRFD